MNDGNSRSPRVDHDLHSTLERIRAILVEYRHELQSSETSFQAWQDEWNEREQAIDRRMTIIESKLRPTRTRPQLAVVHAD